MGKPIFSKVTVQERRACNGPRCKHFFKKGDEAVEVEIGQEKFRLCPDCVADLDAKLAQK